MKSKKTGMIENIVEDSVIYWVDKIAEIKRKRTERNNRWK